LFYLFIYIEIAIILSKQNSKSNGFKRRMYDENASYNVDRLHP